MKPLVKAILCYLTLIFFCCFLIMRMPINREANVHGWEYNTTRNTSLYVIRDNISSVIMPKRFCDQHSFLVVMVCSAPQNFKARSAIRNTWGYNQTVLGNNVSLFFLLGEVENPVVQENIVQESQEFRDIIQERFIDSYNNLTLKSIVMLKLASTWCSNKAKYLLKIDDDMYVNMPHLIEILMERNTSKNVLMGKLICGAIPIKNSSSKWYAPNYMYNEKTYPNYLSGTGYLMSLDVAVSLFKASLVTPIFHLEDVYLTGICAKKVGIRPRNNPLFTYRQMKFEKCHLWRLVTIHHFSPDQMQVTHKELSDPYLHETCGANFSTYKWVVGNVVKANVTHRRSCLKSCDKSCIMVTVIEGNFKKSYYNSSSTKPPLNDEGYIFWNSAQKSFVYVH